MSILRLYHQEDYSQIIDLFLLNTPQFFCPPEQRDLEEYLKTEVEHYSVIEEGGNILACGGCNIEAPIGWLSWYIVHPEHHGRGLGKQIAEHNLQILKNHPDVAAIKVRTSQLVYPFYEKLGFVLISTTDNYWGEGMHLYEMDLRS
jgi:ribosomal-protein-alanine N-acetyltransferase